ncbi:putative quinol monooxygenase [Flagellimonas allohymeniacidonis]|uniref:Antibiotic biosynthesis monooxygenase n=1 Tax=Flagellimonas allohymeniacidonis TaxID=2517819 RepID=A0A4V6MMA9_9FLAO|nr:antibiotic biosynthesis monooxygenase [Allomuricauda hymeniacidonis]TAI48600.1 antibiotic biosynthesis monooxygenase [Allomuricauda hymeniacidonis]
MLVRIVKLTFKPENISSFERIFENSKKQIVAFDGCSHLELYQDLNKSNVFFTYSIWANQSSLENYRNSTFFQQVWGETKKLFSEKPEAWSVAKLQSSNEF